MKTERDVGSNPSPASEGLCRPLRLSDVSFHVCKVGLMYPTGCQRPEAMHRAPNSMPSTHKALNKCFSSSLWNSHLLSLVQTVSVALEKSDPRRGQMELTGGWVGGQRVTPPTLFQPENRAPRSHSPVSPTLTTSACLLYSTNIPEMCTSHSHIAGGVFGPPQPV